MKLAMWLLLCASHTQPGVGGDGRYHIADGREDCQDVGKEILIHKSFTPRRPKDFTTVKKRGIVLDGLVQSKLLGFIAKYPELRIEENVEMVLRMTLVFRMFSES